MSGKSCVFISIAGIKYRSTTELHITAIFVNNNLCQICFVKQNQEWWISFWLYRLTENSQTPHCKNVSDLIFMSIFVLEVVGVGSMQTYSLPPAFICITDLPAYQIEPT